MIGIYGGTFDPIHYGHLRSVLEVYQALDLQKVRIIPCAIPPHRDSTYSAPLQRLAMVRAAITDMQWLELDDREILRGGPSYTVDTLVTLRNELGRIPLGLILGMDAFMHLDTWFRWEDLLDLAHIIVTHRPGCSLDTMRNNCHHAIQELLAQHSVETAQEMKHRHAGAIVFQPVTQLDISSTHIRQLLQNGKDIRFLLPNSVYKMIKNQNIYE